MFEYTKTSIKIALDDVKKFAKVFKYGSLVFTSAYFVYAIIMKTPIIILNIVLASLFASYTIFDLIASRKRNIKFAKKIVKRSYGWVTLLLKLFSLGVMIYGIYNAATNVHAISIILATLMIILWVLQAFLELVISIVEDKVDLITAGWQKDIENIKMPKTKIDNFFKKIKGEKIPPPPEKTREIIILEKKMAAMESEKKEKEAKEKQASSSLGILKPTKTKGKENSPNKPNKK